MSSSIGQQLSGIFESARLSAEMETFLVITALSFLPFFLVAVTTFTRNIIVLSFLRHALGLQQSPPNIVLISLAMFITIFTMSPVFEKSFNMGVQPYFAETQNLNDSLENSWMPIKGFLISQTHESDIKLIYKLSKQELPNNSSELTPTTLIPAFLLSELKTGFKIGFIIFLPFLLIDLVMAAILMSLGMIMVPPITISLPLKIMLFVVVDGWGLIAETLVASASG
ncbi:Flagellar biosynthetic protein FliP [Thalassocella blandensis]|nr:Flagellar biosynthetic protein FliP [Thalassocella blandensis]